MRTMENWVRVRVRAKVAAKGKNTKQKQKNIDRMREKKSAYEGKKMWSEIAVKTNKLASTIKSDILLLSV